MAPHRQLVRPGAVGGSDLASPLGYSDGTKFSRSGEAPGVPAWRERRPTACRPRLSRSRRRTTSYEVDAACGATTSATPTPTASPTGSRPRADPATRAWWAAFFAADGSTARPWAGEPASTTAPCDTQRSGRSTSGRSARSISTDPDVDGDTLLDGEDDQDNDDFTNIAELYETGTTSTSTASWPAGTTRYPSLGGQGVNAVQPAARRTRRSRTCPTRYPF